TKRWNLPRAAAGRYDHPLDTYRAAFLSRAVATSCKIPFLISSALFFILSRSLSPNHWQRFYGALLLLLLVDSMWIGVALCRGIQVVKPWLQFDIILGAILIFCSSVLPQGRLDSPARALRHRHLHDNRAQLLRDARFLFPIKD